MKQTGHLIDKRTGAARANAVHSLFQAAPEVNDLGILTAELDGHIGLRREHLQRRGNRHHLLHKSDVHRLTQIDRSGSGDSAAQIAVAKRLANIFQQLGQGLLRLRIVAAIFSIDDFIVFIQNNQLDGCGPNVNTGAKLLHKQIPQSCDCNISVKLQSRLASV